MRALRDQWDDRRGTAAIAILAGLMGLCYWATGASVWGAMGVAAGAIVTVLVCLVIGDWAWR